LKVTETAVAAEAVGVSLPILHVISVSETISTSVAATPAIMQATLPDNEASTWKFCPLRVTTPPTAIVEGETEVIVT
jgi:hypothetical protein